MSKSIRIRDLFFIPFIFILLLLSSCSILEGDSATATPGPTNTPIPTPTLSPDRKVGTDITIELPRGDPENGHKLARRWDCVGCHETVNIGPGFGEEGELPAILARAEMRISDPAYSGEATTPEEYLIEAIILPVAYVLEGNLGELMDDSLYKFITVQDLADIMAWMLTFE
jgi:hypothetical protein